MSPQMNTVQSPLRDFRAMLATAHQVETDARNTATSEANELQALFQRLKQAPSAT